MFRGSKTHTAAQERQEQTPEGARMKETQALFVGKERWWGSAGYGDMTKLLVLSPTERRMSCSAQWRLLVLLNASGRISSVPDSQYNTRSTRRSSFRCSDHVEEKEGKIISAGTISRDVMR